MHIAIILPLINNTLLISSKFKFLRKKKININSKTLLLIALPVLLILIFATSTLYLTITNRNLQKDVDTLHTQIEEALATTASNTNSNQQKELSKLNEQLTNLQTITQTLSKYPQIDKGILETIDKSVSLSCSVDGSLY